MLHKISDPYLNPKTKYFPNDWNKWSIGMDQWFNEIFDWANLYCHGSTPHNIVTASDGRFIIEVALAGFEITDISVTTEKDHLGREVLVIQAKKKPVSSTERAEVYQGISEKDVRKTFLLGEFQVSNTVFHNGLLEVMLEKKPQPKPEVTVHEIESI